MPQLSFSKMHGAGNDYLYVDATQGTPPVTAEHISRLSHRRFGIGSDGMIFLEAPRNGGDIRMRMHNADGSEGNMCGNALRCIAKLALDRGLVTNNPMTVETNSGPKTVHCETDADGRVVRVRADLDVPSFKPADIPMDYDGPEAVDLSLEAHAPELFDSIHSVGEGLSFTGVSMGNSHAVFFVEELTDDLVLGLGPVLERHRLFPERANIDFARIDARDRVTMRVWERGSGETLACGTGACAVAVAGAKLGLLDRKVTVTLLGGELDIEWDDADRVWMTGPAEHVFEGVVEI